MELNELKNSWNVMNERLEKSEVVNLRMVKEMIAGKTKTAFNGIFNINLYNFVVTFVIIAMVFPWVYMNTPISTTSFVIVEVAMVIGMLPMAWKIVLLSRFDVDGKTSRELCSLLLRYKQVCHQENLWTTAVVALAMVGFYISEFLFNEQAGYAFGSRLWLVAGMTLLTFAVAFVIGLWQRRRHATQMREVENGLLELREFEN